MSMLQKPRIRLAKASQQATLEVMKATVAEQELATVCQQAKCPNLTECWSAGTATLMLLGEVCTRGCRFCAVKTGDPNGWVDADEPAKVAQLVANAGWRYVVLTMVDRDDLPDGGARHVAQTVAAIRDRAPQCHIELLIGDFQGKPEALQTLAQSQPDVIAHNLETVERLTPTVRDRRASWAQSLAVLRFFSHMGFATKSSLMLGLGETAKEIAHALNALQHAGTRIVTLGQYLQPSPKQLPVVRMVPTSEFDYWQQQALHVYGFDHCASGPLVRSSYRAADWLKA